MASYHIKHITRYTYSASVKDCANQIMLYPLQDEWQQVLKHEIEVTGNPVIATFTDYFGNETGMFTVAKPQSELTISSVAEVSTQVIPTPLDDTPAAVQWLALNDIKQQVPYMDFLQHEAFDAANEVKDTLDRIIDVNKTPFSNALILADFVFKNFKYKKGVTSVQTSVDELWQLKAGVCQDFAHVLLVMLHMMGIPARYVSGYICPKNHDMRGEGATHAWVEAYIPGNNWVGIDPTNNCLVSDRHVRLAVGRNFSDCTPVKGTYKGSSEHTLEVLVSIKNGELKPEDEAANEQPAFMYHAKNPAKENNSYRQFLEMQQQQQ